MSSIGALGLVFIQLSGSASFCTFLGAALLLEAVLVFVGVMRSDRCPPSFLSLVAVVCNCAALQLQFPVVLVIGLSLCSLSWTSLLVLRSRKTQRIGKVHGVALGFQTVLVVSLLWREAAVLEWPCCLLALFGAVGTAAASSKKIKYQHRWTTRRQWNFARVVELASIWLLAWLFPVESGSNAVWWWGFLGVLLFVASKTHRGASQQVSANRRVSQGHAAALVTAVVATMLTFSNVTLRDGILLIVAAVTATRFAMSRNGASDSDDSDNEGSHAFRVDGKRPLFDPATLFDYHHSRDSSFHKTAPHHISSIDEGGGLVVATIVDVSSYLLQNPRERRLFLFFLLTLLFMFVELIVGMEANSLGLVSDAFHMLLDGASIAIGLCAAYMQRWGRTRRHPFGFSGYDVLSGFTNGVLLVLVALFLFIESLHRLFQPPEVDSTHLMFVAVSGLLVNIVGVVFFHDAHHGHSHGGGCQHHHHDKDHNLRGVYLHILADLLGSIGVIGSTFVVKTTGWMAADPLCSAVLSLVILASATPLLRETSTVLLGGASHSAKQDPELLVLTVGTSQRVVCRVTAEAEGATGHRNGPANMHAANETELRDLRG